MVNKDLKQLLVATAKGLLHYILRDGEFVFHRVLFAGFAVNMVFVDERNGRWWAGLSHKHWGQKLHYSDDGGLQWHNAQLPVYDGRLLANGKRAKLRDIWCMAGGGDAYPSRLWLGTDPGGLFMSENGGATFHLVEGLWNHPSRSNLTQWFGAGSDQPFIHSILVHPEDADHIYVGVSCAGVFETQDGGKSWEPKNEGLVAAYLPNPYAEVGHDPHAMYMCASDPSVIWQQNHCGVFYTKDGGESWQDVSDKETLPYYGFAVVADDAQPSRAWVAPVESDENRIAPDLLLRIYRTDDFGKTWVSDSEGLPEKEEFGIVLRQAMHRKGDIMSFGTTNGNVYYRVDGHSRWKNLTCHLTKVNMILLV